MGKLLSIHFLVPLIRPVIKCCAVLTVASGCVRQRDPITRDGPGLNSLLHSPDAVAAVGRRSLAVDDLNAFAVRSVVIPDQFVYKWALDALLAESARGGILHPSRVNQTERGVLARALLTILRREALSRGEPTEEELRGIAEERWFEVDRPAAAVTTHFVVRPNAQGSESAAEQLAHKLAALVRGAQNAEEFQNLISGFPKTGLQVIAESLPPITRDGRSLRLDPSGAAIGAGPSFDQTFARAAASLTTPGEQSGVIHTQFGFHVIMLDRIIPPSKASTEALRAKFAAEVYSRRVRGASERVINEARQHYAVSVESSFQEAVTQLQASQ